ncbi:MAG: FimB/Mfa2 family fimbrial subunit [Muribaculaceae bacterium]|nr:FimB/Mfa2 family fimbrial subunit [Muribaculaceae bacterium]
MRLIKSLFSIFALIATALTFTACNGMIYDDEGDCDPHYKVRFIYDTNLKFTDAFPAEVFKVTLYVIDPKSGQIIWQCHESSQALRQAGYLMDVPVNPGDYTLLAWCGEGHKTHFDIADASVHTGLTCTLNARTTKTHFDGRELAHVDTKLDRLYHGKNENVNFPNEQGTHIREVRLVKNTNDIHILLQHLSGENINPDDFSFAIETENGLMDWDNSLLPDEPLVYRPYMVQAGTAGVDVPDYTGGAISREVTSVSCAVAHLTVGRIMEDRASDFWLNIYNKEGERIVHIPFIDYALLVRGYHTRPDGSVLAPQDYLDYQDDYPMTFFLDENGRWMNAYIYVESWRVILQNSEL